MAKPHSSDAALHQHYYLHNFLLLCETVERQYGDILNDEEQSFLARFYALSEAAQCLYVRMVSRVGPWFRLRKLDYPEIGELGAPMQELAGAGFAVQAQELSVEELARLFTVVEMKALYRELLEGPIPSRKVALIAAIEEISLNDSQHMSRLSQAGNEQIWGALDTQNLELFQLLFFGNRHQGLTDFVLSELGLARYYPYALNAEHRLFPCREALDEYRSCCEMEDLFYGFLELEDGEGVETIVNLMLKVRPHFEISRQRWLRVWNAVGRELERHKQLGLAWSLYERSDRHPARERRARILEANEEWHGVLVLCEEILVAPRCEAESEAATKILKRARRKLGEPVPRKKADNFQQENLTLIESGDGVEWDACAFFESRWNSVYYVENSLMNTLFALAFWPQIFADIPGAFHNPFQGAPRDMYEADFTLRRSQGIEQRLAELRKNGLKNVLLEAYRNYAPYQCHWADWRTVDQALLTTAVEIIPAEHLFAIWERQLFDPAENRSGFPDLIAFGEKPGDYLMIEVKGPGDALQNNQKRWLRYFKSHLIPASIAWVEWRGDD